MVASGLDGGDASFCSLLRVLDSSTEGLTDTDGNGTNGVCGSRCEDRTSSARRNSRNGWDGSCGDEDGADDTHRLGVLGCDVFEGSGCVQQPRRCFGFGCDN